jgi:tRNA 2-thiouridine synthesizing protein A
MTSACSYYTTQRTREDMESMNSRITVDARGTRCPVPINELARTVETASGGIIELLADDPNARVDVPVWCRLKHHDLIEVSQADGAWRFVVRTG